MRSSKNCDLQFANNDIFKANYSIDYSSLGNVNAYTRSMKTPGRTMQLGVPFNVGLYKKGC